MRDGAFAFGRSTLFARKARASGQAELFESFANAEALDEGGPPVRAASA